MIEPGDWNLGYCLQVFKRPISLGFKIERTVVPKIVDEFAGPGGQDTGYETAITVTKSS